MKIKFFFGFLVLSISLTFLVNCKSNRVESFEEKVRIVSAKDSASKIKTESKDSLKDLSDVFKLHYDATVIDTHNDFLYQVFKRGGYKSESRC